MDQCRLRLKLSENFDPLLWDNDRIRFRGPKTHPKSRNTKKTLRSHELFRKVRANFSLLSCDTSQEPSGKCSEKLVQIYCFVLGGLFSGEYCALSAQCPCDLTQVCERFPLGEHAQWRCDTPPHKRRISVILARYHMKTRQMGAISPPLRYSLERYCAIWAGISHWAAKVSPKPDTLKFSRHVMRAIVSNQSALVDVSLGRKPLLKPVLILMHATRTSTLMRTKWFNHIALEIVQEHLLKTETLLTTPHPQLST